MAKMVKDATGKSGLKEKKARRFPTLLIIVIVFIAGTGLGFGITHIKGSSSSAKSYSIPSRALPANVTYPYLNPLLEVDRYQKVSIVRIDEIETKVRQYIKTKVNSTDYEVSLYFRDLISNRYFGIAEKSRFSPSSLMKVPIMITVLKAAQRDPGVLNQKVTYTESRENKVRGMNTSTKTMNSELQYGNSYTVEQLLEHMVTQSDNEATILLLDFIGEGNVKKVEHELGYLIPGDARFFEDVITVRQYSAFFRVLYNASYLNPEYSDKALQMLAHSEYGHGIRRSIPAEVEVSHKYGRNGVPISNNQMHVNQLHHFAVVHLEDTPYLVGIMTRGDDERVMEKYIFDLSSIIYNDMRLIDSSPKNRLHRDTD